MKKFMTIITLFVAALVLVGCEGQSTETVTAPTFVSVNIDGTNPSSGTGLTTYFKERNETILVQVVLNNPDDLEIRSIVIDGYYYRHTRFSIDSTSSIITFEIEAGDDLGEHVYSIDDIEYFDGSDVLTTVVNSNNEFKVLVFSDAPVVNRTNYSVQQNQISLDLNIIDRDAVIVENTLVAELFSGEVLLETISLNIGQQNVTFSNLDSSKPYEVKVKASYDVGDDRGLKEEVVLLDNVFTTLPNSLPKGSIKNIEVLSDSIMFDVDINDDDVVIVPGGLKLVLQNQNDPSDVIEYSISGDIEGFLISNLLNANQYTITLIADYDLRDGLDIQEEYPLYSHSFTTAGKVPPRPILDNLVVEENRILFDIVIDDPELIIDETTLIANLYIDGSTEPISTSIIENYQVELQVFNILAGYEFDIEILGTINLNDGSGDIVNYPLLYETLSTTNNRIPVISVGSVRVQQGYVRLDFQVIDTNQTLKGPIVAVLYENGIEVSTELITASTTQLIFSHPFSFLNEYSIELIADYNLRNGDGTQEDVVLYKSVLAAFEPLPPAAEIRNISPTKEGFNFDVLILDADSTIVEGSVVVVIERLGMAPIILPMSDVGTVPFSVSNLLSDNLYTISIVADYDVLDGSDIQEGQVLYVKTIATLPKVLPNTVISNPLVTVDSISVDIFIEDEDEVTSDGSIFAQLYKNNSPIGAQIPLTVGSNDGIEFDQDILSDNSYDIKVFTVYDLNDGTGESELLELGSYTVRTDEKTSPVATIQNISSNEEEISMDIIVTDFDGVITGNTKVVLYVGDSPYLVNGNPYEIALNVGLNPNVTFENIHSDRSYNVRVVTDYDLNDGTDVVVAELLDYDFAITDKNELATGNFLSVTVGIDTITFSTIVVDDDSVIVPGTLEVILYEESTEVARLSVNVGGTTKTFTNLVSDSEYTLQLVTNYNLRDEDQVQTGLLLDSFTTSTNAYTAPTGTITSLSRTINSFEFDITFVDLDNTSVGDYEVEIWQQGVLVENKVVIEGFTQNVEFENLLSGVDYEIRLYATYDLYDVFGQQRTMVYTRTERTIAKKLPVGSANNIIYGNGEVRFDFDYIDEDQTLIPGSLVAELYLPGIPTPVATHPITSDQVVFDISGLIADYPFTVKVSCEFDLSNGNISDTGTCLDVDLRTPANTFPQAIISDIAINQDNVQFRVNVQDEDNVIVQNLRAVIYNNLGAVVATVDIESGITDINFAALTLNHRELYSIIVEADINMRDGSLLQPSTVLSENQVMVFNKFVPQARTSAVVITNNSISFDIEILDTDSTYIGNALAVLYDGDTMVDSFILGLGTTSVSFTSLISDHDYRVEFIIDYNNEDGNGTYIAYMMLEEEYHVAAKQVPTATVSNEIVTSSSIQFDTTVVDTDAIISGPITAVLYKNGIVVDSVVISVGTETNSFTNLDSDSVYEIKIVTSYDLQDLSPEVVDAVLVTKSNKTTENSLPSAVITNVSVTSSTYDFTVQVTDNDNVILPGTVYAVLYKNSVPVDSIAVTVGAPQALQFANLNSNSIYTINIQADYDLKDGVTSREDYVMINNSQVTLSNDAPTATITAISADYDSVTFNVSVVDHDSTIIGGTLFAALYFDGVPVAIANEPLLVGINQNVSFDGVLSNRNYEVKIITNYNLLDGTGIVTSYELASRNQVTNAKATPNAVVTNKVVTNTSISFDVNVTDNNQAVQGNLQAIIYKDGVQVGLPETLVVGANSVSFTSLEFGKEYEVRIVTDYNNNTGSTDVLGYQMTQFTESTRPLIIIDSITNIPLEVYFDFSIDDFFDVLYDGYVQITVYDKDSLEVADTFTINVDNPTNSATVDFINYYNNHEYSLVFTAKIDDGAGSFTVETVHEMEIKTPRKQLQSIALQPIAVNGTDIITGVSIVLPDSDLGLIDSLGNDVYARLYKWNDVLEVYEFQAQQVLVNGDNNITFSVYDGSNGDEYIITIEATLEWNEADLGTLEQIIEQRSFVYITQN